MASKLYEEYASARKELRKAINKSKKQHWEEICNKLDEDIFGDGYKIVINQLKITQPKVTLTTAERISISKELFVLKTHDCLYVEPCEPQKLFQTEELIDACNKIKKLV